MDAIWALAVAWLTGGLLIAIGVGKIIHARDTPPRTAPRPVCAATDWYPPDPTLPCTAQPRHRGGHLWCDTTKPVTIARPGDDYLRWLETHLTEQD